MQCYNNNFIKFLAFEVFHLICLKIKKKNYMNQLIFIIIYYVAYITLPNLTIFIYIYWLISLQKYKIQIEYSLIT